MGRKKALRKFMMDTCDFQFNFMEVYKEWSLQAILKAIDIGEPIRHACIYLGLDSEVIEKEVKLHTLRQLYKELSHLTKREIELMTQYSDHKVLGYELGSLLNELMFLDPQSWLDTFENSILYMNDNGISTNAFSSVSELSMEKKREVLKRVFEVDLPFEFGEDPLNFESDSDQQHQWSELGRRPGSGYHFFCKLARKDWFLHPHPNDLAKNNRRTRLREQEQHFRAVLKDILRGQHLSQQDLDLYENELNTTYLEYAAARISYASQDADSTDKRKWDAIIKIASLFTIAKSSSLQLLLLDNLVRNPNEGEMPFNMGGHYDINIEYTEVDDYLDNEYDVQDGRVALYMIILFIAEFTLKSFVRNKLKEACLYFGHKGINTSEDVEEEDKVQLTDLKMRLIPLVLLRSTYTEEKQKVVAFDSQHLPEGSDSVYGSLYKWIYHLKGAIYEDGLFSAAIRDFLLPGRHKIINKAQDLVDRMEPFDLTFKEFADIKPEDLGLMDLDKLDKLMDELM